MKKIALGLALFSCGLVPCAASADDPTFTWGGNIRERVNYIDADLFGLGRVGEDTVLLHRLMLNGDVRLNEHVRFFGELGNQIEKFGDLGPGPFDESRLDLHQAYADFSASFGGYDWTLRPGRQEITAGSARLLSTRDGPNVRLSYDAVRLSAQNAAHRYDVFVANPLEIEEGVFDDTGNEDETIWGLYSVHKNIAGSALNTDLYYIGLRRGDSPYAIGAGDEKRHSVGVRLFGERQGWDWNTEGLYQFGDFDSVRSYDIRAWTVAAIGGYTFKDAPWSPRLGLSVNYASGDDEPDDGDLNTFNPIQPRLPYFNEASQIVPQNFFNFQPSVTVQPLENLSLIADWNFFFKAEEEDALYVRGLIPLRGTRGQDRFALHAPTLQMEASINTDTEVILSYTRFFVGDSIEDAGGEDSDYVGAWVKHNF